MNKRRKLSYLLKFVAHLHSNRMMHLLWMSLIIFIINSTDLFVSSYLKSKMFNDDGDPGDALYLTKYIEKEDIKTV